MLKVYCKVHDFLKLILTIFANSALDGVNKGFGFAYALTKKSLEFLQGDGNISFILYLTQVLLPAEQASVLQENSCKQNLV